MSNKYYNIVVRGYGGELVLGTITKAQYEYWKDKDDDLPEHVWCYNEEDDPDIPEDAVLGEWYENDDIEHVTSCGISSGWISINEIDPEDKENPDSYNAEVINTIYEGNLEDLIDENDIEIQYSEMYVADQNGPGYYFKGMSIEKGCFWDGILTLPDNMTFDPSNLIFNECDYEGEELISDIRYVDGDNEYYIDSDGGDTVGKGSYFNVWEEEDSGE